MERYRVIEKSIIKRYRKPIWAKFVRAINDFDMIQAGDKIAVCISGGKDSMLLAKCLEELKRHGKVPFELVFLVMDPGYHPDNLKQIQDNLATLHLDAHIFQSNIFEVAGASRDIARDHPCYLCARMRRGNLYSEAQKLGCNKIALGHHMNDVVETILMNMIYNGQYASMMPKLHSTNFPGMELIRPLYYVRENYIKAWAKHNDLTFIDCACSVTKKGSGKRQEMKQLVEHLVTLYPDSEVNIMGSASRVNLNMVVGYQKQGKQVSFLDDYQKEEK